VDGEIPVFIGYYDPGNSVTPLKYSMFTVLPPSANLRDISFYVRGQFGLAVDAELEAWNFIQDVVCRQIAIDTPLGEQGVKCGMIVFQHREVLTHALVEAPQAVYRITSHVPSLACPTVESFWASLKRAMALSVATFESPETVQFRVILQPTTSVAFLLTCLRSVLRVGDESGLLLFAREAGTTRPSTTPIQTNGEASVDAALKENVVYYHQMPDLTQDALASTLLFRLSVYDESSHFVNDPILIMPTHFSARDVFAKLVSASILPADVPIRLLQLNGSRIVKEVDPKLDLSNSGHMSFRAEVIPEDQRSPGTQKVKLSFSHDSKAPRGSTFGTPFFLTVLPGETFADTRARILAIAQIDGRRAQFAYTNNCLAQLDRTMLKDTDVLASLLSGRDTMLYVILPGGHSSERPVRRDGSLRIYN
jgi:hypothetical protein